MPQCYAYRLNLDGVKIASVSYFDAAGDSHEMAADVFVIAGSAIESARLCLLSGLANPNIGRNLMFHFQTLAVGVFFPGRLHPHRGRTVTHMFDDFAGPAQLNQYAGFKQPRGGTTELAGGQPLLGEAKLYLGPLGALLGFPGTPKDLLRLSPLREHLAALTLQGEDLPQLSNQADLDPGLKDVFGIPVARITYQNHPYEIDASNFYQPIMADVLTASAPKGAMVDIAFLGPATEESGFVPTSAHIMGTLRMGNDPATSVTDPGGKFHGIDNLYAADGSLFPTSGGMNPSLTIMALGYRVGCSIVHPNNPLSVAKKIDHALLKP